VAKVETLLKFIRFIKKHPNASDREIAQAIGVTVRYVKQCKKELEELEKEIFTLVLSEEDIRMILEGFNPRTEYEREIRRKLERKIISGGIRGKMRIEKRETRRVMWRFDIALILPHRTPGEIHPMIMHWIKPMIYEPLIWVNINGEIEPRLAELVENIEGFSRWRIKLRKDVRWSDGNPITVDDVFHSISAFGFKGQISLAMANGRELILSLSKADPLFPWKLKSIPIRPASNEKVVSGAYKLSRRDISRSLYILKSNPGYYRLDRPLIGEVAIRGYVWISTALRAFENKEIEFISLQSPHQLSGYEHIKHMLQNWGFGNRYYLLLLNKNRLTERLCEELKEAIDHRSISVYLSSGSIPDVKGRNLRLKVGYISEMGSKEVKDMAKIIARSISNGETSDLSGAAFEDVRKEIDLICTRLSFGLFFSRLKRYFHSEGSRNIFGYKNRKVDEMLEELDGIGDLKKRRELGERILRKLQKDFALILLAPSFDYFLSWYQVERGADLYSLNDMIYQMADLYIEPIT